MPRIAAVAVALVGLAALAPPANAQVVIGTRPSYAPAVVTPYGVVNPGFGGVVTSGYYSPYPGYLYSPYASNYATGYSYGYGYNYNAYSYGRSFSPYGGYTTYPRHYGYPGGGRYRW
jgi:hypothetical protein